MLEILKKKFALFEDGPEFHIDDSLPTINRITELAKSGHSQQRTTCLEEILDACYEMGFVSSSRSFVPIIAKLSSDTDASVRGLALRILSDISGYLLQSEYKAGYEIVTMTLIPLAFRGLDSDGSVLCREEAAISLMRLSSHLRSDDRGKFILFPVISRLSSNSDEEQRILLTGFLGTISSSLGTELTSQYVVAQLCSLGEDGFGRVRKTCVKSLSEVSRVLDPDQVARRIIPVIVNLCSDQTGVVRTACAENFHYFLSICRDIPEVVETMSSVYLLLLNDPSSLVRQTAVMHVGHQLALFPPTLDSHTEMLSAYISAAVHASPSTFAGHSSCATTFAAILMRLGSPYWDSHLKAVFNSLVLSPEITSRKAIAESLGPIAAVLGSNTFSADILTSIMPLLADSDTVSSTIHSYCDIIPHITSDDNRTILQWTVDAITSDLSWRLREKFAGQISNIVEAQKVYNAGEAEGIVWDILYPVWKSLVKDPIACVRSPVVRATGRVFASLTSDWHDPSDRSLEALVSLNEMAKLKSVDKQVFLQVVAELASFRAVPVVLWESAFLESVSSLARDGACTVRTTWARNICPLLRSPGGRLFSSLRLVQMAYENFVDSDEEVVRLVQGVTYAPLDEIGSSPTTPVTEEDYPSVARVKRLLANYS